MAIFAVTYFFETTQAAGDLGGGTHIGWTETWYRDYPSIEAAIEGARNLTDVNSYLRYRLPMLSGGVDVVWVRVSSTEPPPARRLSKVANLKATGSSPGNLMAQTTCALLVDFTAIVGTGDPAGAPFHSHRRPFLMRGLPASVISGNIFVPTAAFADSLSQFLRMLTRKATEGPPAATVTPWRIRYLSSTAAEPILGLTVDVPPTARTITIYGSGIPLAVGQRVRLSRVNLPARVNRIWTVLRIIPAGVLPQQYVLGISRRVVAGAWDNTGFVRLQGFSYAPATNWLVVGLRARKVGRPSHPLRGRRSAG